MPHLLGDVLALSLPVMSSRPFSFTYRMLLTSHGHLVAKSHGAINCFCIDLSVMLYVPKDGMGIIIRATVYCFVQVYDLARAYVS